MTWTVIAIIAVVILLLIALAWAASEEPQESEDARSYRLHWEAEQVRRQEQFRPSMRPSPRHCDVCNQFRHLGYCCRDECPYAAHATRLLSRDPELHPKESEI